MHHFGIEYEEARRRQQALLREACERRLAKALRNGSKRRVGWLASVPRYTFRHGLVDAGSRFL